jgi:DNA-binding NarL/FixJ family response regulator
LVFHHVHGGQLIYNACWEDPRIDRELMRLNAKSRVVMITSAGCNALDYLLDGPAEIAAFMHAAWGTLGLTTGISVANPIPAADEIPAAEIDDVIAEALAERLSVDDNEKPHERLSDREFQTLVRLSSGQRLSDIATELNLSPKTVSVYRARVLEKLGMQSNADLTAYCLRNGLID